MQTLYFGGSSGWT